MSLNGQIAIVTGAGNGIGAASATALSDAGATVVAADIKKASADLITQSILEKGGKSLSVETDVGDTRSVQNMINQTIKTFGQIDIILNNAGVTRRIDIMDITENDWDHIHRVNAKGVFLCLQGAAREMIPRRRGRIINIASIAGRGYPGTTNAAYAASKGAVISLTKTASQQLARHNINVNSVCPGVTETAISRENLRARAKQEGLSLDAMQKKRSEMIPIGRSNDPSDIAAIVVFLASPGSQNVTGQAYNVDGGIIPS